MQFADLKIENFMGIGEASLDLADKGLVLIQGENRDDTSQDSNGAGKSTVLEALFWCLYGKTSRGLTGDAVVNEVAGKGCFVEVRVFDGGVEYWIARWRKKTIDGKRSGVRVIKCDDGPVNLSKGTDKMTQEVINDVLGCSEEVFSAAVYAAQETMPDIPKMTDRQLKGLIEEGAGIELIEEAYQIARERAREEKALVDKLRSAVERDEEQIEQQQSYIEGLHHKKGAWESKRDDRVKDAKFVFDGIVKDAKAAAAERDAIDLKGTGDELEVHELAIEQIDAKIEGLQSEKDDEARIIEDVANAKSAVKRYKREFEQAELQVQEYDYQEKKVEDRIGDSCGECGKPVTKDDLGSVLKGIRDKREVVVGLVGELNSKLGIAEDFLKKKEVALDLHRGSMTDVSELNAEHKTHVEAVRKLHKRVSDHQRCQDKVENLKRSARAQADTIEKIKTEANPFIDMIKEANDRLEKMIDAKEERRKEFHEACKAQAVANAVVEVYGPKGVRAHILDTVTPYLNDRTSHYLGTLSDGRLEAVWSTVTLNSKGEMRENFSLEVQKDGGGKSFAALSGGEKRKVRLSCALALQDLVASRATKPINIWLGDEIDVALDPAGMERLMGILEMKAREKGTVLIVSHQSLRDWVRDVTQVTMENGQASVTGVLEAA